MPSRLLKNVGETELRTQIRADIIGNAVHVMRIATGQVEEKPEPECAAVELGSKDGRARASALSEKQRSEITRKRDPAFAPPAAQGARLRRRDGARLRLAHAVIGDRRIGPRVEGLSRLV
jgi:hypothetical protein